MHPPTSIVIVDDDPDHVFIVRHVLSAMVPVVPIDVLSDPQTVRDGLQQAGTDALVLMDRMFAGTDTIDWLPDLCATRRDLRIVVLSAALFDADYNRAMAANANAAFEKPMHLQGWRLLLQGLLSG